MSRRPSFYLLAVLVALLSASSPAFAASPPKGGGIRTVLIVPMLKEDELIGAFAVYRQEVRPFTRDCSLG